MLWIILADSILTSLSIPRSQFVLKVKFWYFEWWVTFMNKVQPTVHTVTSQLLVDFTRSCFSCRFPPVLQAKWVSYFDSYIIYFGSMLSPLMSRSDRLYLDDMLIGNRTFHRQMYQSFRGFKKIVLHFEQCSIFNK